MSSVGLAGIHFCVFCLPLCISVRIIPRGRWCARRGYDQVDDLIGGGVDLDADAALWEDFLTGLKLSSPILGNRIRRELMRRRNALCEAPPPKPSSASPSPTKGRGRRFSGGGIVRACPIQ